MKRIGITGGIGAGKSLAGKLLRNRGYQVLDADKALLEHRINGVQSLAKVLSKEQLEKFNQFHKDRMKKFREHMKKGPQE